MLMLQESYSPAIMILIPIMVSTAFFAVWYRGRNYILLALASAFISSILYMASLLLFEDFSGLFIIGMADILMIYGPISLTVGAIYLLVRRVANRKRQKQ